MKTQSNIPIPDTQLWKEGQWAIAINKTDHGYLPTGDPFTDKSRQRYDADFTIIDALTAEAALYAFTRQQQNPILDNKVIDNIEVNGVPAIDVKPVYANPISPTIFPVLPNQGWMEIGHTYSYNDGAVMVVQSHERTIYPPEVTPALFSFYRPNTDDLLWIPNEQVELGWKRWYNDIQYYCIQAHMTLEGWTPDVALALWSEIIIPPANPPQWVSANWVQYTPIGFEVSDLGKVWKVKTLTHTWIQPALTGNGAISWTFVRNL
jgi:hypothetical protein